MAMTVAQLANLGLTANQQTKLESFRSVGAQLGAGTDPDISSLTLAQAKTVMNFAYDLRELEQAILRGALYVRDKALQSAAKSADDAAPAGSL
jgi:hypothetical protein